MTRPESLGAERSDPAKADTAPGIPGGCHLDGARRRGPAAPLSPRGNLPEENPSELQRELVLPRLCAFGTRAGLSDGCCGGEGLKNARSSPIPDGGEPVAVPGATALRCAGLALRDPPRARNLRTGGLASGMPPALSILLALVRILTSVVSWTPAFAAIAGVYPPPSPMRHRPLQSGKILTDSDRPSPQWRTANGRGESQERHRAPFSRRRGGDGAKKTLRALLERPTVSIRARIAAAFLLMFALLCGVTVTAMLFISESNVKLQFLEQIGNYRAELQQARRFEKDFFLYGTNLPDALANIHMAKDHLERSAEDIESVVGTATYLDMKESVTQYESLLERLLETSAGEEPGRSAEQREIEILLRRHGAKILADADEMIDRERMDVHSMLRHVHAGRSRLPDLHALRHGVHRELPDPIRTPGPWAGSCSTRRRIGAGDYSPIMPTRKYRDEFSNLAIAINQMLSDLVLRQEQLTQSGKMAAVGTLTSGIAHELNNPLNNIGITTEALIEDYADYSDEERLKMLDQIYTQVERASGTVRNLLDFTRKEQSVFTSVSVPEIVKSTARLVGNELKLGGIELSLDLEDELPEIKGNPRNLQQVFLNLFLNAIQAMPEGGRLDVRALTAEDGFVRVDVSDTGVGIPAEQPGRRSSNPSSPRRIPERAPASDCRWPMPPSRRITGESPSRARSARERHSPSSCVRARTLEPTDAGQVMGFSIYLPVAGNAVNIFLLLGLGGVVGFLSGLFGVGGGFLLTPLLIMIGVPPTVAAASDSNQIVAASASGTYAHARAGSVDFKMGIVLLIGGIVGGSVGVFLIKLLRALGEADFVITITYVRHARWNRHLHVLREPGEPQGRQTPAAAGGRVPPFRIRPIGPQSSVEGSLSSVQRDPFRSDAPAAGYPGRSPCRRHGGRRRVHHGAGDGLPAADAHARRGRDQSVPDPLHLHQRHHPPGHRQPHRGFRAGPDSSLRIGDRRPAGSEGQQDG